MKHYAALLFASALLTGCAIKSVPPWNRLNAAPKPSDALSEYPGYALTLAVMVVRERNASEGAVAPASM